MVQTKKPHVSRNLPWCWMIKEVVPVVKRLHAFFSSFVFFFLVMFLAQIPYNFCAILTTFFKINHWIFKTTYPMIKNKNKNKNKK